MLRNGNSCIELSGYYQNYSQKQTHLCSVSIRQKGYVTHLCLTLGSSSNFPAMVRQQLIQEVAIAKIYLMTYPSLFLSRTVQSVLSENTFSLCYIESSISIIETMCVKLSGEL